MNTTSISVSDANAQLKQTIKMEWERFKSKNPQFVALKLKLETHIYKARPPGYFKVYLDIMERLLWHGYADKTQKAILDEIRSRHSRQNITATIWNKPLKKKQLETMKSKIQGSDRTTMNISITGCRTLAEIKECIRAHIHSTDATHAFKGAIAIDSTNVVIGKKTYPITVRPTGKYHYPSIRVEVGTKRLWVRVDVLAALLEK